MNKKSQAKIVAVCISFLICFLGIGLFVLADSKTETENFKVTFEFSKNSIIDKCLDIDIQNLNSSSKVEVNLLTILNETNIDLSKSDITMYEWKALDKEFPTYDTEDVINYHAYPNETNGTFIYPTNCWNETSNLTHYPCNEIRTFQNGTEIKKQCDWKPSKMGIITHPDKFEFTYANITIPQYSLGDVDYDDFGTIETFNGTKKFRICFSTPILNNNEAYGSKGTFYLDLNGEIFWDKTHSSWWNTIFTKTRKLGNLTGNFSYMNLTYDSDMQTDFDDLRFTNTDNDTEFNYTISDKVNSAWVTVRVHNQGDSSIYMYYGNTDVTTTSNASDTYFNPVSAYYLDEASGDVIDAINTYNFSLVGTVESSTGIIETSRGTYSTGNYFTIMPSAVVIGTDNTWAISIWFKTSSSNESDRHLFYSHPDSLSGWSNDFELWIDILSNDTISVATLGRGSVFSFYSGDVVTDGKWHNVVASHNASGVSTQVYVDGEWKVNLAPPVSRPNPSPQIELGYLLSDSSPFPATDVYIDEVILYNKGLISDQIYQLYTQNEPSYTLGTEGSNTAPTITANVTKPDIVYTNTNWLINLTATDPEETYLDSYVQFYVNDSKVGSEITFNMTNNTNHQVAFLGSGNFSKGDILIAEVWVGNRIWNTSKVNLTSETVRYSRWNIDTFTVDLTEENLTFQGNENISRNLTIPYNALVGSATMNLSGFGSMYLESFNISAGGNRGITQNGTFFWVINTDNSKVYKYSMNGTYIDYFSTPSNAWGITQNGTYIWVTIYGPGSKVYKYSMNGTYIDYFSYSENLRGITQNGTFFWVIFGNNGRLYKLWMNGTYAGENLDMCGNYISNNGTNFFGIYDDKIFEYSMNGTYIKNWSVSAGGNQGITQNGTFFWVSDSLKISKYTMPGGYLTNPYIQINNTKIWNIISEFFIIQNKTNDFASVLNTALNGGLCDCDGCVLTGTSCNISTLFHSDTVGILEYSAIDIQYTPAPFPTLESPSNNSYSPSTKTFNCSVTDEEGLSNMTFYFYNSTGSLNLSTTKSLTGTSNSTTYSMTFNSTESYTWGCSAYNNNSRSWWADDNFTINVDITFPQITTAYPTNTTYVTAPTNFNFTYTETNPDKCWYSNDSGTTNYSIQACTSNFTGMVSTENNANTWIVYINDSAGNENSSSITFTYDTENPNATLYSPENNTYLNTSSNNFTSNLTDNLGLKNVTINIYNSTGLVNQTTQSLSDATSYTWGIVIDLADDVYTWFITLFDNANNSDTTVNQTFTIDTTYPLISLIYPLNDSYTSIQTQLNFSRSDTNLAGCWYSLDSGVTNSSYDSTCANLTGLDSGQGTKTWVIYVNDSSGNENSSSVTFFVDSIVPVVDIEHPHPQTYAYNESLPLNYTSTDTNLEACWYKVVNSTSDIIINNLTTFCLNTTFNVPRSDDYTLTLYSNDTLGNENLDTVTFQISLTSPSIVLDYPTDNLWLTEKDNIYFNFTATDTNGLDVCELWTNSTGTWHKNVTFTGIISGTQNNTQINLAETKGYIWNVWCNDTTGLDDWALNNFTFNVDTTDPLIEYTTGTKLNNTNTTNTFIFVNVTASDTNENNIVFKLFNQTSQVNSTILTNNEREFNFTNLPDEIYTYNVTITDDSGRSNTTTLRTITLDDTVPTLNIILPQAINYADNNSIKLNYTVSDNLIGLDVCWYNVINSTGDIIISNTTTGCLNTTFGLPSGDIDYTLTLYANDTLGNTNSNLVIFGIRTESPVIVLTPVNNTYSDTGTNLTFNFSVTTNADSITNCSLYGNFNGTWLLNQTILIPVEGANTSFSVISLTEGDYIWNALCYDNLGNNGWADNLSYTVDLTYPSPLINSITPTANSKTFWFNQTTTDTNIDSCKYSIYDATNAIDGGNENVSFTCGTGLRVNATVTDYATYTLKIYAIDLASNENSTNSSFTTSEAAPTPTGGGGGITTIEADTGFCGDGICNESRGETFFNCPEDCSQAFPTLNLDNIYFNCFDDDETTECIWTTNPGLFIVLGFMLFVLMFSILFEFKKEAVGIKKWTFKPKIKKWRRWRR